MTVGRPIEFDRDAVLDAAMGVFWEQGYEATSVQDLIKSMGLSKSSLYQSFGDKQELFRKCLERYKSTVIGELDRRLASAPEGRLFVEELFYSVANGAGKVEAARGCLVVNSVSEFSSRTDGLALEAHEALEDFARLFLNAVKRAQAEGDIPSEKCPTALARYLVGCMSGLRILLKSGCNKRDARAVVEVMLSALSS